MWFRRETDDIDEADKALKDAQKNLRKVKSRQKEVTWLSTALREFREQNHIGEQIDEIVRGKG